MFVRTHYFTYRITRITKVSDLGRNRFSKLNKTLESDILEVALVCLPVFDNGPEVLNVSFLLFFPFCALKMSETPKVL